IASAPPFALLDGDAAVLRVVVRGDAAVAAQLADGEVVFSGLGMATWTERVVEGVTRVRLTVPGSTWTVLFEADAAPGGRSPEIVPQKAPETVAASSAASPAENTWGPDAGPEQSRPEQPRPVIEEPRADPDSEAYDFLFGDTIYRTQAGASIRIPNPDPQRPGDHDGHTMLASDLGRSTAGGADGDPASEATVLAPIPPRSAPVPTDQAPADRAEHAPSLPLGPTLQLERADGSREALNRPVLIGRSPAASGSASEARLITIVDDPDISRTHLRVAVEGDAVVVTDLGSKNGSIITLPGAAPRKLRASEPTVVLPGTLIDLGGGTTFTVRED
ncbi:MAG TPA: FHA domain-containing protein, partial [Solirubrobacteraceae bacterium]|nr:FHA domain-containing protein [Solirubrobacteraceae bacterium]